MVLNPALYSDLVRMPGYLTAVLQFGVTQQLLAAGQAIHGKVVLVRILALVVPRKRVWS
jgi:hypothetical protein